MSQTAITLVFEQWKAQQAATGEPVLLDEFVFALVPGLDPALPVDRNETLPPAAQIVYRAPVTRKGVVNENSVVHSAVLGAEVGDFSFNWIGLMNKASGTLAMIVHAPEQQKLKTNDGQQGNVLTRSFLMEFTGAQTETAINTPAETWQIDFTARMAGMDERQRLENIDIYGAAAFFGDGWLVGKSGNQYFVTKGVGYVAGLRAALTANQNITVTTRPVKVWLDVSWTGTLTSIWSAQSKITVAAALADYEQDGVKHYVFALASIDVNGIITDLRPKGSLGEQQGNRDFLRKDANLADVNNKERVRSNLELKTAALRDVQTARDDVTDGRVLVNGGTFAVGVNQVGLHVGSIDYQFDGSGVFTAPGGIKAQGGATELAANAIYIRGAGNKHLWFYDPTGAEMGLVYASDDKVIHMRAGQGPSLDVKSNGDAELQGTGTLYANNFYARNTLCIGDNDTGFLTNGDGSAFIRANSVNIGWWDSSKLVLNKLLQANAGLQTSSIELTGGASVIDFHFNSDADDYNIRLYNNAYNQLSVMGVAANPLFNHSTGQFVGKGVGTAWGAEWGNYQTAPFNASNFYSPGGDTWCPLIKGHGQKGTGYVTSISFGYYIPPTNSFNNPVIYARNDNGSFGWWMFNNQGGDITYSSPNTSFTMAAQPWVNNRLSEVQNWTRTYFVQSIRFGASGEYQERGNNERVGGGVMTSFADRGSSNYWIRIRPLQYLINDVWYTASYS